MNRPFLSPAALSVVLVALAGCSNMRTVSLDSMRPADVTFPSEINSLLIIDRSIYQGDAINLIESVLTGELPGEDRSGVQAWISAFQSELMASPRFETVVASEMLPGNSLTSAFPPQIPWHSIDDLTRRYQADAVVAIEIYDTDFTVADGGREPAGSDEEVDRYTANGTGSVLIGLRVYNPGAKSVLDQRLYRENETWAATGVTLKEAVEKLINKGDATRALSRRAGADFAHKIAPMPVQIRRSFYAESDESPAVEQGARYADVGNWQSAVDAWEAGIRQAARREAGQLAYNVAVGYEVLGQFEKSREWAEKAYVEYGNDKARAYVADLNARLYAEELAGRQLQ